MARTIAKDHNEKRAQILATAARVFAAEGVDRASMSRIARDCGISKANIYHYYDSKDALLFDLLEGHLGPLRDRVLALPSEGQRPGERLRAAVREILSAYQGTNDVHKVQISGMAVLPDENQKVLRGYQRDLVQHMSALIAEIRPERFRDDPDTLRATTMSVFGMLNWYFMWNSGRGSAAREAYADLVTRLTLGGIPEL